MKVRNAEFIEKATRMFTDREEPRKAFWDKYNAYKSQMDGECEISVLSYYGIGGIGKSSLLKKLMAEMEEQLRNPYYVYIDLANYKDMRHELDNLKRKLADKEKYGFKFPLFELGFYVYAQKIGESADSADVKQFIERSSFVKFILDAVGLIPGANLATSILKLADQGVALIRNLVKKNELDLKRISYFDAEELYKYLPVLFAKDMNENMKNATEPLVVFIDTYECLVNEISQTGNPLMNDEWLRGTKGVIQNTANVMWVIGGREELKWERFDAGWSESLEQHLLGNLSEKDACEFLESAGVENQELRKQLYKLTNGTPVYLDLCVDRYISIRDRGETPDITMFGENTTELIDRFIRYMGHDYQDFVYMLACISSWTENILFEISKAVFSNSVYTLYERTKNLSFVIHSDDGKCSIHQTVGDVLMESCPERLKKNVSEILKDIFMPVLEREEWSTTEFISALIYVSRAAVLGCDSTDELCGFYNENIYGHLYTLADAGLTDKADEIIEKLSERAAKGDKLYAVLLFDKAYIAGRAGRLREQLRLSYECVPLYEEIFGKEHENTFAAMNRLASALDEAGKCNDALKLKEQVLEKCKAVLGDDHHETLSAMDNLACALIDNGKCREAYELLKQLLEKVKKTHGEDSSDVIWVTDKIADVLSDMGDCEQALELKKQVVEKVSSWLGEAHPDTIHVMSSIADTLCDMGSYDEALKLREQAFEKLKKVLDEDHPDLLTAMSDLAYTIGKTGENEKALELKKQVLEKCTSILGEEHPNTLTAKNNLADTFDKIGDHSQALELKKQVLESSKTILGEDHVFTLLAMGNLAGTLGLMGRVEEELELETKVYEQRRKIQGENHPATLTAMNNLAGTLGVMGRCDEEIELESQVIEKRKAVLGEEHPSTVGAMLNLIGTLYALGRYDEVIELERQVLDIRRRTHGENHPDTVSAMQNLACTLDELDRLNETSELKRQIFEICKAEFGEEHPNTITAMNNLAFALSEEGEYEEALKLQRAVVEMRRAAVGEEHPDMLTALCNLVVAFVRAEEYTSVIEYMEQSYEKFIKVFGKGHEVTLTVAYAMIAAYANTGNYEKAEALNEELKKIQEEM